MKKDIMERWVSALKSGQYTQTTGDLKNKEGHCCLGVLCEIYLQDNPTSEFIFDELMQKFTIDTMGEVLPESVRYWAGVGSAGGKYGEEDLLGERKELWALNDQDKFPFEDIAEAILTNWENI